jgi:putative ABC transport system permease protein
MALPALTAWALGWVRLRWHKLLPMLALERAHRLPHTAASAVSGVVAALSLAVALTVMVSSFRQSVTQWLDVILPADVYVRASPGGLSEQTFLDAAWVNAVKRLPQVKSAQGQRVRAITWDSQRAPVVLIAREQLQAQQHLPLVGEPLPIPPDAVGVYVSEAMVDLYGIQPGQTLETLAQAIGSDHLSPVFVAGVWRDYARQSGSIMMTRSDYLHLSGDARINDLALNLHSGTDMAQLIQQLRDLADAQQASSGEALEVAATAQIRATSLRLFDRSFAVTYWLQAVAIGIGLFGIAASFSAQVLARRKEFGLLVHLGLSRTQVLTLVASEGAAWTAIGAVAGVCLGMAVSVILVHVVNPQSFHWTMDLHVPVLRLLALCVAVLAAGTLTAWLSGRAAASHDAVLAVKEDW